MVEPKETDKKSQPTRAWWKKLLVLGVVVAAFVFIYVQFGDRLNLDYLAEKETELRALQDDYPILVYAAAFLIYAVITGLSVPGAAPLTLLFAWYFGFVPAVILVSFASTTGATVAFLLSRYLFRDTIQNRFGDRLTKFNDALKREGPFFLFMLRLIPLVPFWVINLVMGLTPIRTVTYWWISQVGMLPGTAVYCYAGASVPNLQTLAEEGAGGIFTWNVLIAFILLGTFPLLLRLVFLLLKKYRPDTVENVNVKK